MGGTFNEDFIAERLLSVSELGWLSTGCWELFPYCKQNHLKIKIFSGDAWPNPS